MRDLWGLLSGAGLCLLLLLGHVPWRVKHSLLTSTCPPAAFNWHSVDQQLRSVAALRGLPFRHVLPGHGRRAAFAGEEEREAQLAALLAAEGYGG